MHDPPSPRRLSNAPSGAFRPSGQLGSLVRARVRGWVFAPFLHDYGLLGVTMRNTVDTVETTMEQRRNNERHWRNRANATLRDAFGLSAVAEPRRPIAWGAIMAGVVLALALQLGLGLVGHVAGFVSMDGDLVATSATWLVASAVVSLFVGGAVASRLADVERRDGMLHGLLTWGLVTIVAAVCLSVANGRVVSIGSKVADAPSAQARMKDVADIDRQAALVAIGAASDDEPALQQVPSMPHLATSAAAYWALAALLASALAGAIGGHLGAPRWSRTVLVS